MSTTASIIAAMDTPKPECFWLIARKPCGREFRRKIKRRWVFGITLAYWPFPCNGPEMTAQAALAAFQALPLSQIRQLPDGGRKKIEIWLAHFATRHANVAIRCVGNPDPHPEWTATTRKMDGWTGWLDTRHRYISPHEHTATPTQP